MQFDFMFAFRKVLMHPLQIRSLGLENWPSLKEQPFSSSNIGNFRTSFLKCTEHTQFVIFGNCEFTDSLCVFSCVRFMYVLSYQIKYTQVSLYPSKNVSLVFLLHISDLVPSTSLTVPLVEKYLLFIMISGQTSAFIILFMLSNDISFEQEQDL